MQLLRKKTDNLQCVQQSLDQTYSPMESRYSDGKNEEEEQTRQVSSKWKFVDLQSIV